ncbi:MAG: class I SAM-dependent methyltransferase [Phycisphaerae bacterium]
MKTRESGMPDQPTWDTFFDPEATLRTLGLKLTHRDIADFGCGYGTFSIPAAKVVTGVVHSFDIDPTMIAATNARAKAQGVMNIRASLCDFISDGTGLPNACVDYAMLFNILHAETPDILLREGWRILSSGGLLAIMHWNYDPTTPRGPSMAIRPKPGECRRLAEKAGFELAGPESIALPPYHYGLIMSRL